VICCFAGRFKNATPRLRYQDIERSQEGVSPNTLSAKTLNERGIIDPRFGRLRD
jgi:hypothetical protein